MAHVYRRKRPDGTLYPAYYCDISTPKGIKRHVSTRCTSRRAAEAAARRLEEQAHGVGRGDARRTVLDATGALLAHFYDRVARGELSAETVDRHIYRLTVIAKHLGADTPLYELDRGRIEEFLDERLQLVSRHTVTKDRTALKQALRLARKHGWYPHVIEDVFERGWRTGYTPRSRWLRQDEAPRLLAQLRPAPAAVCAFALATGAESGVARFARREDFDLDTRTVHVRGTKNAARNRVVPILPHTERYAAMACWYLELHHAFDWRWRGNVSRTMLLACRKAEIEPTTLTDLRRTACMWLRLEGVPAELAQLYMGHTNTSMVQQVYGRLQGAELGEAMRRHMGGGG